MTDMSDQILHFEDLLRKRSMDLQLVRELLDKADLLLDKNKKLLKYMLISGGISIILMWILLYLTNTDWGIFSLVPYLYFVVVIIINSHKIKILQKRVDKLLHN